MAYRGGRGDQQQQQYGGGWAGAPAVGGRGGGRFPWPPPGASSSSSAPRPAAPGPYTPAVAVYHNPNATGPHQGVFQHGVVYRGPAPPAVRAPSSTPVTVRAPSSTPSPTAPSFQPARVSAPAPSPPTPAAVAKELEQKLFVTETALAPPAAAAAAAVAAAQVDQPEVDLAPVSKKGLAHPARPGAGTVGKKVMIRANHFLVNVADNNLFHYDVSINPESKSRAVNREVLSELIKLHGSTSLGGKLPAYDGRKSLYTAGSLPFESEEFSVTLVDPEKKDKERAEREYKITIRIAGRTDLYHLQQFLKGRQRDMPQETIQVLDVVLRESPSWNYVTVSRSFFSTTFGHRGDIGEGLECWRGYYQSLRPTQMGLSLNIDISATSFFKPVTVIQFVLEFLNLRDASRPLTDRDRVKIKKALRGVRVETNHQEDQIRRYKITGITPVPMSQLIFPVDERGTRMSVVQYFKQRYDYNLKYTNWPCLQSGSDARPVYLPMEACKIVEGQRYSKKLNDKQVTNILRATCQRPQQREQSIRELVLHNKYAEDKFAQEFGIQVCSDLVAVPARVLPPPMLRYHDSGKEKTCAPNVGQWNMINKKMINGGIIDNWACVSFSRMSPEEVHRFCCDLIQMCNMTGMSANPRPLVDNRSASPMHIENALRDAYRRTIKMLSNQGNEKQFQLLIVILPEVSGSYGMHVSPLVNHSLGFLRDGVSEGQFSHVLLHEMDAIRKACASLEEGHVPPVTFVIVQKRHHTRLFPEVHVRRDMTDKSGNILPGTVVDLMICYPTELDFYLCSHTGIQVTSKPSPYHGRYGENHFTAEVLQSLTNNLCYMYANRTRAVSVESSTHGSKWTGSNIFVDTPLGSRITVDVPLNESCQYLKMAIEAKLGVSIDQFTLRTNCKYIEYDRTLKHYGIGNNSVIKMGVKLLGGAKRSASPDVSEERKKYRLTGQSVSKYVGNSSHLYCYETIPDIWVPNATQREQVLSTAGNVLGQSFIHELTKAVIAGSSWNGKIQLKHFKVLNGRVVCMKPPTKKINNTNFSLDCNKFATFFERIFITNLNVHFMDDLLTTLRSAQPLMIPWLVPYLVGHYAFKTILERGTSSCNIWTYYEDLKGKHRKEKFRSHVNRTKCTNWTSNIAQQSHIFIPTINYSLNNNKKTRYSPNGFGAFRFQRNFIVHSKKVSAHLRDLAVSLLMGRFMCKVVKELLKEGWGIANAIGA